MIYRLVHADVLEGLRSLPDESVQCVVTSPPYWGLRDYGVEGQIGLEPTPDAFVSRLVDVFREVRRVLRDDGTLWLNLGDSYAGGGKGGNPPDSEHQKQKTNRGSLLHAGLHETQRQAGVIDRSWQKPPAGWKQKDLIGIPWMVAFALRADGWYLRSDIIWHKPNPMPESVTDRPTKAHEYLFLLTKSARYYYDSEAIAEDAVCGPRGSRFDDPRDLLVRPNTGRNPRPSVARGSFQGKTEAMADDGRNAFRAVTETRNKRTVWTISTESFPEAHFATFPTALVEPCILAGSRVGDTVLDPFNGSGTTGVVALGRQRNYVGIELNPEYVAMARRRLASVAPMFAKEIAS